MKKMNDSYQDYQVYNDLAVDKDRKESAVLKHKGNRQDELLPYIKECEELQERLDQVKFKAQAMEGKAAIFGRYIRKESIDNSDPLVSQQHRMKLMIRLKPTIIDDYGIDGVNALVQEANDRNVQSILDLHFPWRDLPHLELDMYERLSDGEENGREKFLDNDQRHISPDDLPF